MSSAPEPTAFDAISRAPRSPMLGSAGPHPSPSPTPRAIGLAVTTGFYDRTMASGSALVVGLSGMLTVLLMVVDPSLRPTPMVLGFIGAWIAVSLLMLYTLVHRPRASVLMVTMVAQAALIVGQFYGQAFVTGLFALSNAMIACLLAWPAAALLSTGMVGAIVGVVWLVGGPMTEVFSPLWLPQPAVFGFAFGWALRRSFVARTRAQGLAERLSAMNEVLEQNLRATHELVAAQERARIAQDLHDRLGHCLTTTHLYLEVARREVEDSSAASHALDKARRTNKDALGELRSCVSLLRGPEDNRSLSDAVRTLLDRFPHSIITTHLSILGPERRIGSIREFALFRVLQEALTNVARHSRAGRVEVTLRYTGGGVALEVADDGVGCGSVSEGVGLTGIRERLAAVGGRLSVDSRPGAGFRLRATLG